MKVLGKIDLFKNKRGYVTGVLKAYDNETSKFVGESYIDVVGVVVKEGETLTIDVKEGYLNCIYVNDSFSKLVLSVVDYDVVKSFKKRPVEEKKEGSK